MRGDQLLNWGQRVSCCCLYFCSSHAGTFVPRKKESWQTKIGDVTMCRGGEVMFCKKRVQNRWPAGNKSDGQEGAGSLITVLVSGLQAHRPGAKLRVNILSIETTLDGRRREDDGW